MPIKYTKQISLKSVEPFRRGSTTTNTMTGHFYILDNVRRRTLLIIKLF